MKRSTPKRFFSRIKIDSNGCWIWQGAKNIRGYGVVGYHGILYIAHRLSYKLKVGPIPEGLLVCHKCDVPPCINPDHLFIGTYKDNSIDMVKKGRAGKAKGAGRKPVKICKRGHIFDKQNTRFNKHGHKQCKKCAHIRYLESKKEADFKL